MTKRNLFKKLGNDLIVRGAWFLRKAFIVKVEKTTGAYLKNLIAAKTGLPANSTYLADRTYFYTDLETVKDILKYDLVDEKKYEAEKYDCDDFAQTIYSVFRYVFEINSMGTARQIEAVDKDTGNHLFWHRANIFLAKEGSELKVFYLEPQNDYIAEITGKDLVIGNKRYIFRSFDF